MIRYGDITGYDDAEVIERGANEDDRQDVRCTEMGSADTSSGSGNTVLRNSADMGIALRGTDSWNNYGD